MNQRPFLPCSLLLLLSSCVLAVGNTTEGIGTPKKPGKVRELEYARAEMRNAELDAEAKRHSAEAAVAKAERELEQARAALASFSAQESQIQLDQAGIQLDRAKYRADEAKDELAELEAMYKAEEFAKTTKELVLKRGRRQLGLAERDLDVAGRQQNLLRDSTLPRKRMELDAKAAAAAADLEKARRELDKARGETELAIRKARDKAADLEKEVEKLKSSEDS